ncbi:MAG: ATPase, T2SS/T4P/T4SS family [Tepidisphaeraceae bacterium]|jgi:type II secretory ATPase GspE/PulE/Tfp pilus assembly ATPase PilB-like protein
MQSVLATISTTGYLNPYKAGALVVILLIWVKLLAWVDKDAPVARMPREIVNSGMFLALAVGYVLFFFMPQFSVALSSLLGCFVLSIGTYIGIRAKTVGLSDLKLELINWWNGMFKRAPKEAKAKAGQILFVNAGGAPQEPPTEEDPERLGYDSAQTLLITPLKRTAERIEVVAADTPLNAHLVDGMKYDGGAMDRAAAGAAIQYLKGLAGLDLNERRKPQTGSFKTVFSNHRTPIQITTQGNATGESARLLVDPKNRYNIKYENLGFTEGQLETFKKTMEDPTGVVLLSAPKAQGLTTLAYGVIRAHDAFMYHIHTIERAPEADLEGITQNALTATASGAEEAKQVNWVVSQEPDIIMLTSIEDRNSAQDLAKYAAEKRAYICMRSGNTFDTLAQWRKLVADDNLAMKNLRLIISGRLVRRLCEACKIGYTPDPTQLRKLNMSPDSVGKLFAARKEPMRDAKGNPVPCEFCHDLGFKGRMGIYEFFIIDDEVRKIVAAGGSDAQLKQAFRKQRGRLLQEVALGQVQVGETSLEEVLRVLRVSDGPPGAKPPGAGPAPAPAAPRAPRPAPRPAVG